MLPVDKEIKKNSPNVPIILLGTKQDLRFDQETIGLLAKDGKTPVSYKKGLECAKEIGAQKYLECSAFTQFRTQEVLDGIYRFPFSNESCDAHANHL